MDCAGRGCAAERCLHPRGAALREGGGHTARALAMRAAGRRLAAAEWKRPAQTLRSRRRHRRRRPPRCGAARRAARVRRPLLGSGGSRRRRRVVLPALQDAPVRHQAAADVVAPRRPRAAAQALRGARRPPAEARRRGRLPDRGPRSERVLPVARPGRLALRPAGGEQPLRLGARRSLHRVLPRRRRLVRVRRPARAARDRRECRHTGGVRADLRASAPQHKGCPEADNGIGYKGADHSVALNQRGARAHRMWGRWRRLAELTSSLLCLSPPDWCDCE
mmetsp:Transcript_48403/g.143061  ORF Transcript_48403/g.143061 Transcript_48403/m.143061 type:complete len:278 (+) Transcript_48403:285-1118(+)